MNSFVNFVKNESIDYHELTLLRTISDRPSPSSPTLVFTIIHGRNVQIIMHNRHHRSNCNQNRPQIVYQNVGILVYF